MISQAYNNKCVNVTTTNLKDRDVDALATVFPPPHFAREFRASEAAILG